MDEGDTDFSFEIWDILLFVVLLVISIVLLWVSVQVGLLKF